MIELDVINSISPAETKREAHRVMKQEYKKQSDIVLEALRKLGMATYMDIAKYTGLLPTSVDRSLNHLYDKGSPNAKIVPIGKQYNLFNGRAVPRTIWRVK